MIISDLALRLDGEQWMTRYTDAQERPTAAQIARLAYHFYDTRGRQDGHDVEDWLLAEEELKRRHWLVEDNTESA
jgi:DUF2934 family protein